MTVKDKTNAAPEKKTNATVEMLKKMHSAEAIERKDFSLTDLFKNAEAVTIMIVGFASKLVPKYAKEENPGYHTMIYLQDGKKTGAFSNALHEFANFFYEKAGIDTSARFKKLMFPGGVLEVLVTKVDLGKGKSTYNFEIIDGDIDGVEKIDGKGAVQLSERIGLPAAE